MSMYFFIGMSFFLINFVFSFILQFLSCFHENHYSITPRLFYNRKIKVPEGPLT